MVAVAAASLNPLSHAARKRVFLVSLITLSTFFVFLVELEHIHVIRYHAKAQQKLQRPLSVPERLALFKHHDEIPHQNLPPIESIIDKNMNIIGDPQPLLSFAIIGFGKCGTSTLMYWLADHPQLQAIRHEVWDLVSKEPGRLVEKLYRKLPKNLPRGFKCPSDINQEHVLGYYRRYFPKTKLFVGIRHPVWWFQSLYNFRIQNFETEDAIPPHPNRLIGGCQKGNQRVCTIKGNFAYSLIRLGKQHWNGTRETTALEKIITQPGHGRIVGYDPAAVSYLPNEIFLFDLSQLGDKDIKRRSKFRSSIKSFLGLTEDLSEVVHVVPGIQWNESLQTSKDSLKIDICDHQYIPLRRELMFLSRNTAEWIRTSFLDLPGVNVANREHFEGIMESYMHDPCGPESDAVSEEESKIIREMSLAQYANQQKSSFIAASAA